MGNKMTLCWIAIALLVVAMLAFWKIFRKKIVFREVVTGGLVYLIARLFIYQTMFAFAIQAMGENAGLVQRGIVGAALDAVILILAYLVLYRLFYSKGNCSANAISVSFGSSVFELFGSTGYTLLSYGLVIQAVEMGTALDIFISQGYDAAMSETVIAYFSGISASAILLLFAQGIAILLSQLMVALLVYYAMERNDWRMLVSAFAVVFLCDITYLAVGAVNEILALVIFVVFLIAFLYYVLMSKGNIVEKAMAEK